MRVATSRPGYMGGRGGARDKQRAVRGGMGMSEVVDSPNVSDFGVSNRIFGRER